MFVRGISKVILILDDERIYLFMGQKMTNQSKGESLKNNSEFCYYSKTIFPIGTVYSGCVLLIDKTVVARGIAIKSLIEPKNDPNVGFSLARSRAIKAYMTEEKSDKILCYSMNYNKCTCDRERVFEEHYFYIKGSDKEKVFNQFISNYSGYVRVLNCKESSKINCKTNVITRGMGYIVEMDYYLPQIITTREFEFKSEYKPTITSNENQIILKYLERNL